MAVHVAIVNDKSNVYDGKTIIGVAGMKTEGEWAEDVKRLLRAEMARRGLTYEELAEQLAAIGLKDSAVNLRNKVARGRFSAVFLVQCLTAMGARALRLSETAEGQ
jgi:Domain of unknown function (DUF6471)